MKNPMEPPGDEVVITFDHESMTANEYHYCKLEMHKVEPS